MKQVQDYNKGARSIHKMPDLKSGDIVKVHRKITEGNKERIQIFEGIVIAVKGGQSSSPMVTVRRVTRGIGVEVTIPLISPAVEKIDIIKKAKTRKAKLYYLRSKDFKLSKLKTKELDQFVGKAEEPEKEKEEAGNQAAPEKIKEKSPSEKEVL